MRLKPRPRTNDPAAANLLDRLIGYVAPKTAARRVMQRQTLAAVSGGYNGARVDRAALAAWRTSAGSPDSDVIADLPALRARCADLERNSPVGAAVVNTSATHVVGTGLACNPQIDAEYLGIDEEDAQAWQANVKRRWMAWAESQDCDLARSLNFYQIQELALRSTLSRGDVFVLTPMVQRASAAPRLALQLVEADRVSNPNRRQDTDTLTAGIEHSPATGEPLRYYVANRHPGDLSSAATEWTPVEARGSRSGRRNVLHLYRQLRPGLRRGVPILAPVIEPIRQLTKYTEAELQAAVVSGLFAVFLRMDPQAFQDLFDEDSRSQIVDRATGWSGEMEAGKAINLLPGEEPVTSNPGRPNAEFDHFTTSCMRQIGMAIGLPFEVLVMHYQSSYSAARGALLMAWRHWNGWRAWMATTLCQPVYELWLADEVSSGRVAAPGFFSNSVVRSCWCGAQWVGDGPGSIDPKKDVEAAAKRLEVGISTLEAESLLHDGVDWSTKHAQQVREANARRAAGLQVHGQAIVAPAAVAMPEPDDAEDPEDSEDPEEPADAEDPMDPTDVTDTEDDQIEGP